MQSILLAATLATLQMWPEFARPDPFGAVVSQDRSAATPDLNRVEGARGGYVSFHLVVKTQGDYSLSFEIGGGKLQAGLYREWFHFTDSDKKYYPDALIPVTLPYKSRLPEPDNRIPQQTAQAFWVDVWISPEAAPGLYRATATLAAGGRSVQLPLQIQVLGAVVPENDAIAVDHNSYGSSFLGNLYPKLNRPGFFESDALFSLIHAYHRLFYEHRGVFHQLGYGHGGKVGPEFAPALAGSGRSKHVSSWDLYDRHYGPLLDGSTFAGSRRGVRPIPFAYLPVNPEWPASFLWWGEPGYEAEFVNVVSEMERHFREKGWTKTRFELFFNHKKRYKAFPWDGDEVRFPDDDRYFLEYGRLW
ncbi:MAG: hypothetical protein HY013_12840, partial [Candidatus Solibacter usitatus]|nr:hypothetical protein [Candidatus Solibacter usitatus]